MYRPVSRVTGVTHVSSLYRGCIPPHAFHFSAIVTARTNEFVRGTRYRVWPRLLFFFCPGSLCRHADKSGNLGPGGWEGGIGGDRIMRGSFTTTGLKNASWCCARSFETASSGILLRKSGSIGRVAEEIAKRSSRSTRPTGIFETASSISH